MASDAFFPRADGVEPAAEAIVTAVAQADKAVRDAEVIRAADRLGLAIRFTAVRPFRHSVGELMRALGPEQEQPMRRGRPAASFVCV